MFSLVAIFYFVGAFVASLMAFRPMELDRSRSPRFRRRCSG